MNYQNFQEFSDKLPEGMLLLTPQGKILTANYAACRLLHKSLTELVNYNLNQFSHLSSTELCAQLKLCARTRTPIRISIELTGEKHREFSIDVTGFLFTPAEDSNPARILLRLKRSNPLGSQFLTLNKEIKKQHKSMRLLVQSRDALRANEEKLEKSEQLLQNVITGANLGFWDWYYQTGEHKVSERWLNILGLELSDIETKVVDWSERIHGDDRAKVEQVIKQAINKDVPYRVEFRMQHKDESWVWIEGSGRVIEWDIEKGSPLRLCGTHQDISERKNQEELLRRSQKMNALGKLTGGIAHDFNNILGVITGYAELLNIKLSEQPELTEYVNEIYHAGKRGIIITKKLLAFSRSGTNNESLININTLLQSNQHVMEKTLTVRIKLVFDLANEIWPVKLDSNELEDALLNMSINAMHAMDGAGQLTVKTQNIRLESIDAQHLKIAAGDYVLLNLTDTGYGMDDETKEKIFDPFFTMDKEKGTGLGLTQVYGFIKRSNGMIKVYSEPGHGTEFLLYFPRSSSSEIKNKQVEVNDLSDLTGEETILVADDEKSLLSLCYTILSRNGYKVILAENGRQALTIFEKESIDLLLSDVIMPEMDGYQLAEVVQKKYPAVKIQMVSGFSDNRDVTVSDKSLAQNLLHKPYQSKTLLKTIRNLLDK